MQEAPLPSLCEVIILTALPVEWHAVLTYLQEPQEIVHPTGTIYHQGSFVGKQHTWRVAVVEIGMGGLSAATETERAITFFRPQIVLFVGIAGGLKDVKRGDVVAATKVYAYEAGKALQQFRPRPEVWRASYALEQRARAEAHHDGWLTRLNNPPPDPAPQIFVGALAAGEKVVASKASDVHRLLQASYSDALAIEMEGHGFLQAVHANHLVHGLVIRGISDLVDDKVAADRAGTQKVAAQHAAAFAFQVLATFTFPKEDGPLADSPSHLTQPRFSAPSPEVWNVPRRHHPFFTGRSQVLQHLADNFQAESDREIAPPQAIAGLAGIGKTQTAAEYAYRFRKNYRFVLWVRAQTQEDLITDFKNLTCLLNLPQEHLEDQAILMQKMQEWFRNERGWLLIFDNADDFSLIEPFIPRLGEGHILLTTRVGATIELAQTLELQPLSTEDGALCLLRRAGLLRWNKQLEDASSVHVGAACELARQMNGLPLALEQAGAYINDTKCGVVRYLDLYKQYRAKLQQIQSGMIPDYAMPVAPALMISSLMIGRQSGAFELLQLCAFLAPEGIPETFVTLAATALGPVLGPIANDPIALDQQAIRPLVRYSLLDREEQSGTAFTTLSIHRILQLILLDEMNTFTRQLWAERAVRALIQALQTMSWSVLQTHARQCLDHIAHWHLSVPEAEVLQRYRREI